MIDKDDGIGVRTYLTAEEAKDFHKLFTMSFFVFTLIAVVAHFLVWEWRPWLHNDAAKTTTTASVVVSSPSTHT
jgi:light-harvesting complex 1 beta chain